MLGRGIEDSLCVALGIAVKTGRDFAGEWACPESVFLASRIVAATSSERVGVSERGSDCSEELGWIDSSRVLYKEIDADFGDDVVSSGLGCVPKCRSCLARSMSSRGFGEVGLEWSSWPSLLGGAEVGVLSSIGVVICCSGNRGARSVSAGCDVGDVPLLISR